MYVQSTHLVPIRPCWLVFQIIKSTIIRQCGEEVCVYLNRFDQMVRAFYESDFFVRFKNWTGLNAGMENLILREEPTSIICLCRTFQISSVTPPQPHPLLWRTMPDTKCMWLWVVLARTITGLWINLSPGVGWVRQSAVTPTPSPTTDTDTTTWANTSVTVRESHVRPRS